jgi:fatty-acyl-CoA synthase
MNDDEHGFLPGQMMSMPLLISGILQRADRHFGDVEVASRLPSGAMHRYTYRDCHRRARQLAAAMVALGMGPGDRVGTLAWNSYRHLEAYYAVAGAGSVLHTLNPRLFQEQIVYMVNHAQDGWVMFDPAFAALVQAIAPRCTAVKGWIALCGRDEMPQLDGIHTLLCHEELLQAQGGEYGWPRLDENTASGLCYTSGTTGDPKGVLCSHRSSVLHAMSSSMPDAFGLSARDVVCPVVPMFHVNAWGLPYATAMNGAKLVFPGSALDGRSVYELFEQEGVTFSAGVPTVWMGLLDHADQQEGGFSTFKRTVIGGSACPAAMMKTFRERYGIEVIHAWGMTETSPLATTGKLLAKHDGLPEPERQAVLGKQGTAIFGVDIKIVDDAGEEMSWDGQTAGNLMTQGPWVVERYFRHDAPAADASGWFMTGDVATIDGDGYLKITDRNKDVIKSGGEWISSIELENLAMAHPAVQQAACIGVYHPKWDERPLLVIVKKQDASLEKSQLLDFLDGKVAKWWRPDEVTFVDSLPLGATGKVLKNKLREQFREFRFAAEA